VFFAMWDEVNKIDGGSWFHCRLVGQVIYPRPRQQRARNVRYKLYKSGAGIRTWIQFNAVTMRYVVQRYNVCDNG